MELTFNNPQTRVFFKEIFIELFQENKTFFVDVIKEIIDDLNTPRVTLKNNQDNFDDANLSESKAGVYYKCGTQVHAQNNDKGSQMGVDSWDSFLDEIDEFTVDTGIEDFSANLDHYLYGHPKQELI